MPQLSNSCKVFSISVFLYVSVSVSVHRPFFSPLRQRLFSGSSTHLPGREEVGEEWRREKWRREGSHHFVSLQGRRNTHTDTLLPHRSSFGISTEDFISYGASSSCWLWQLPLSWGYLVTLPRPLLGFLSFSHARHFFFCPINLIGWENRSVSHMCPYLPYP